MAIKPKFARLVKTSRMSECGRSALRPPRLRLRSSGSSIVFIPRTGARGRGLRAAGVAAPGLVRSRGTWVSRWRAGPSARRGLRAAGVVVPGLVRSRGTWAARWRAGPSAPSWSCVADLAVRVAVALRLGSRWRETELAVRPLTPADRRRCLRMVARILARRSRE